MQMFQISKIYIYKIKLSSIVSNLRFFNRHRFENIVLFSADVHRVNLGLLFLDTPVSL